MAPSKKMSKLCTPAMFYLVISMISLVMVIMQNLGHQHSYHMGSFSCKVPSTILIFIIKFIYIIFWTWIINLICKDGYEGISWLLVLFPWILLFMVVFLIMINK
jgi:hypothetical protein